jgi:CDP-diacylglycerol--glycerol-3-phosphate 3-phosphatidyltransferase
MNVPNLITILRIALIPLLVLAYLWPAEWRYLAAAAIFGLAAISDWLDGYLARRLGQMTALGAFLDPVADKLIVAAALLLLVYSHHTIVLTLPAIVIVGREILISALREWMAEMNRRGVVRVGWLGKLKTTFQMIALVLLLALPPAPTLPMLQLAVQLGIVLMYVAAVLTLWSMVQYLRAAWPTLRMGADSPRQ